MDDLTTQKTAGGHSSLAAITALYSPLTIRGVTLKNRIGVPPMCQYSAKDGIAGEYHHVHLGKFALGGFGLITAEASAVSADGRITHGDLGIWSDDHISPLQRITAFIHNADAKASIQLAHAGRKASMQRPWFGNGPLGEDDLKRGESAWNIVGATDSPVGPGWLVPHALSVDEIATVVSKFASAAARAVAAGFDAVEIHGAHGYLIHTFLSPLTNFRTDAYGGDLAGRARLALEIVRAIRGVTPDNFPMFFKVSSVDWEAGGTTLDDTAAFAKMLKAAGVDVVVCSSGGLAGPATAAQVARSLGYQVPYAAMVKKSGVMTQAVGLILDAQMGGEVILRGQADLIAIGRQALFDPFWPLHELNRRAPSSTDPWRSWPEQYGWWLTRRERLLETIHATR